MKRFRVVLGGAPVLFAVTAAFDLVRRFQKDTREVDKNVDKKKS